MLPLIYQRETGQTTLYKGQRLLEREETRERLHLQIRQSGKACSAMQLYIGACMNYELSLPELEFNKSLYISYL